MNDKMEQIMKMINEIIEKVEDEKEKAFYNSAFDNIINAFLFNDPEGTE